MERRDRRAAGVVSAVAILLLAAAPGLAQTGAAGSGHWEGTIQLPKKLLKVAVDLEQKDKGEWAGTLDIPEASLNNVVASKILVTEASVSFEAREALLAFEGNLSADGRSIKGGFLSACLLSVPVPIEMQWVSPPAVKTAAGSTAISQDLEGAWEGVVQFGSVWEDGNPAAGSRLAVRVKLTNTPGGIAAGVLAASGGPDKELSLVSQQGGSLRFELKSAGAVYVGERKDGELAGKWSQFGLDPVPLTLRRAQKN
jgi:hypothetical protein